MSAFGDWWVKTRNAVEADLEAAVVALEPQVKQALVVTVQSAVQAALADPAGTLGDKAVAARNAAEATLVAQGTTIGAALLQSAVTAEIASQTTVVTAPAAPTPAS